MSENSSDEEVRAAEGVAQQEGAPDATAVAEEASGGGASEPNAETPSTRLSDRPPGSTPIVSALNSRPPSQPPPAHPDAAAVEPMRPMRRIKLVSSAPAHAIPTEQELGDESVEADEAPEVLTTPKIPSAPPPPRPSMGSSPDGVVPPPRASMASTPDGASVKVPSVPPPRPQMGSGPSIEVGETTFDELDEELEEADLSDLTLTPRADHVEAIAADEEAAPASVEPDDELLEDADEIAAAPEVAVVEEVTPEPPAMEDFEVPPADRKPPPPRRSAKPSLPQAQKPRNKPWWETLFGDDFSRAYRPMSESQLKREVDFIVSSLALPRGAVLLDLGCGQGEICVELARRGYSVVGYDLSVYQLAMAGDLAQAARQKINFLQGDMREMAFEAMFDGVLCWDTTFGYFEEDKNLDVLKRVLRALKPGGRFLLDVMNRDFAAQQSPYSHWFEGDGCVCMDDMNMDWITNRMKVKRSIILDDGRSKELQYSVRLYGLYDIGRMMHEVGFRVTGISGDVATRGAFFGPNSRRLIIEAARS